MKKSDTIIVLLIFIGVTIYSLVNVKASVETRIDETSITISGPEDYAYNVAFSDIDSVKLQDLPELGESLNGSTKDTVSYGEWSNSTWGNYSVCVNSACENCIVIFTNSGETYVFNCESAANTEAYYSGLLDLIAEAA